MTCRTPVFVGLPLKAIAVVSVFFTPIHFNKCYFCKSAVVLLNIQKKELKYLKMSHCCNEAAGHKLDID